MDALFDYRCLFEANEGDGGTLHFKSALIRGPIFEYLYQADFKKRKDLGGLSDAPLVVYPFPITYGQKPSKYQITMEIGDCVVRAQAEGARALIATQVETAEERAALKNIAPAISQCLPAGQTIRFSASAVRSMVAEPLYRLTKAKFGLRHA